MVDDFQKNINDEIDQNLKFQTIHFLLKYCHEQSDKQILFFFSKNDLLNSSNKIQFIIKALLLAIFYHQNSNIYKNIIIHLIKTYEKLYPDPNITYTCFLKNQILNFTNKYHINPYLYNIHNLNNLFKPNIEFELPCLEIIQNDDVDELQKAIISNNKLPFKKYQFLSLTEQFGKFQELYLMEFSAYYGSLRCFKFLYLNKARYSNNINCFAIAGGNAEIIHICEIISKNYELCLNSSIQFHHNDVYEWLIMNKNVEPDIECLLSSIRCHNIILFPNIVDFLLDENKEIDIINNINQIVECAIYAFEPLMIQYIFDNVNIPKDISFHAEAFLAIKISSFHSLEILIKNFDYSQILNSPTTLLMASIRYSSLPFAELISAKYDSSIDYDFQDEKGLTPLHHAILLNDLDKTRFLLNKYIKFNFDINVKDNLSMTPFFYSIREGNEEIVKILLNSKKVKGNDHDQIIINLIYYGV